MSCENKLKVIQNFCGRIYGLGGEHGSNVALAISAAGGEHDPKAYNRERDRVYRLASDPDNEHQQEALQMLEQIGESELAEKARAIGELKERWDQTIKTDEDMDSFVAHIEDRLESCGWVSEESEQWKGIWERIHGLEDELSDAQNRVEELEQEIMDIDTTTCHLLTAKAGELGN